MLPEKDSIMCEISGAILKVTRTSLLFSKKEHVAEPDETLAWLPLGFVESKGKKDGLNVISIPLWLAKGKGITS